MRSKSMFITFEGIDGSGKTTQAEKLAEYLYAIGLNVFLTSEPGNPHNEDFSPVIRELIFGERFDTTNITKLFLFLADRAEHVQKQITPMLESGCIVICDRFSDSTMVYQKELLEYFSSFFNNSNRVDSVQNLLNFASCGITPDKTIYIDADVEVCAKRIKRRDQSNFIDMKSLMYFAAIKSRYESLVNTDKMPGNRFLVVDGNGDEVDTWVSMWNKLSMHLEGKGVQ